MRRSHLQTGASWFALLLWLAGCQDQADPRASGVTPSALVAVCATPSEGDAWVCPAPFTVECSEAAELPLPVSSPAGEECDADELILSDAGPYTPGTHEVVVSNASGELCATEIIFTDDTAPVVESHVIQLWPPNHKFHEIAIEDCVTALDACEGSLQGEFMWASSDEPVDGQGDGHHAPDIELSDDCTRVAVRAERAGPKDGRVYKLGVRVTDSSGNASDAVCTVIVDHDQRGVTGADSGEAYRIAFDGTQGGPACDGVPNTPPGDAPETPDELPSDEPMDPG